MAEQLSINDYLKYQVYDEIASQWAEKAERRKRFQNRLRRR